MERAVQAVARVLDAHGVRGPEHDHDGDPVVYARQLGVLILVSPDRSQAQRRVMASLQLRHGSATSRKAPCPRLSEEVLLAWHSAMDSPERM